MSGPERSGDSDIINAGLSDQLHMLHLPGGTRLLSASFTVWIKINGALLTFNPKALIVQICHLLTSVF